MPRAWSLIRSAPWYRAEAFAKGLRAAGYETLQRTPDRGRPGDVLVIWNRYGGNHDMASRFEREGGTVIVAENGYLGAGGTSPKFDVHPGGPKPEHYYALAIGGHNGQGSWPDGGPERWERLGIELKPWRADGEHVLVCPNRSFGIPGRIMHPDWSTRTAERLRKHTKREVRVRSHPGNDAPRRPLQADLEGAWACVIWSSGAGLHSLCRGIPTYVESPYWICKGAAASGPVEKPELLDRRPNFIRLSWAQWQIMEIESGMAFAALLGRIKNGDNKISWT